MKRLSSKMFNMTFSKKNNFLIIKHRFNKVSIVIKYISLMFLYLVKLCEICKRNVIQTLILIQYNFLAISQV